MHPIERLRYVARASGADQAVLVAETAQALAAFRDDPSGLVAACRRIVDRHPTSAPLWWLCARVLPSPDGQREAWQAVEEIEGDATAGELAFALWLLIRGVDPRAVRAVGTTNDPALA